MLRHSNHPFRIDWGDIEQVARIASDLFVLDGQVRCVTKHKERWNYTIRIAVVEDDKIYANDVVQCYWTISP